MDKIIFENFVLNPTNFVNPTYIAIQTNPTLSNENTTKINCGKSPPKFIMVRKFNACVIKRLKFLIILHYTFFLWIDPVYSLDLSMTKTL